MINRLAPRNSPSWPPTLPENMIIVVVIVIVVIIIIVIIIKLGDGQHTGPQKTLQLANHTHSA